MTLLLEDFKQFLQTSPTAWHTAENIACRLASLDFTPLVLDEPWKLERGKGYFLKNSGVVIAFVLPLEKLHKALLVASHTDSPSLKLKPHPEVVKENMIFFGVESYGGPILTSWLNRDLGIAGKVVVTTPTGKRQESLVFIDDAPLLIPQLSIHLEGEGTPFSKQTHLMALASLFEEKKEGTYLERLLKRQLPYHKLLSHELFLVPLEEPRLLGYASELIASPRLDNLASVHASLAAFASAARPKKEGLQAALFYNHEEVGSRTPEGAASSLLSDTLQRIASFYQMDQEAFFCFKNRSICLSVDNAHAYHPSYPDKYDPNHKVLPGKGIAIKVHAEKKYSTDALGASYVIDLCHKASLPYQFFASHSDVSCGSTVGPLIAASSGIATVDIGAAQFSMHSIREVMGCKDYLDLYQLLSTYYQNPS